MRQKRAAKALVENGGNVTAAMREAGYSEASANSPSVLTGSKGFQEIFHEAISEQDLADAHKALLSSRHLDHMVFSVAITDEEIASLLASVNCTLRKVVHSEQGNHAYFWSSNDKARADALDMAYKIRAHYSPKKLAMTDVRGNDLPFTEEEVADYARFRKQRMAPRAFPRDAKEKSARVDSGQPAAE